MSEFEPFGPPPEFARTRRRVHRAKRSSLPPWIALVLVTAGSVAAWLTLLRVSERDPIAAPIAQPVAQQMPRPSASRPHTHYRINDARCLAGTAAMVAPPQEIHRWVDPNGRVHFSDRPPASDSVRDHTVRTALREPVEVVIEQRDASVPVDIAAQARAHAIGVAKVFGDVLGLQPADGIRMRVVLAGTDAAFRAEAGPRSPSSTGVYRSAQRTMVVRVRSNLDATLRTLRHEVVHALIHEWIGSALPPALEEGLATYFSFFETRGLGGEVDLDRLWRSISPAAAARARDPRALRSLLALDYDGFHGVHRNDNYDTATALIAGLMTDEDTRALLASLLRTQRQRTCISIDAAALLDQRWPGGVGDLAVRVRQGRTNGVLVL